MQETLLAELRSLEAAVFSTFSSESDYLADDPSDPSRKLIRQVLGAVAEYDCSMIALRLRAGRQAKRQRFRVEKLLRGGEIADHGCLWN